MANSVVAVLKSYLSGFLNLAAVVTYVMFRLRFTIAQV